MPEPLGGKFKEGYQEVQGGSNQDSGNKYHTNVVLKTATIQLDLPMKLFCDIDIGWGQRGITRTQIKDYLPLALTFYLICIPLLLTYSFESAISEFLVLKVMYIMSHVNPYVMMMVIK